METTPVLGDQPAEIMDEGHTRAERTGELAGGAFDLENQIGASAAADDATRADFRFAVWFFDFRLEPSGWER